MALAINDLAERTLTTKEYAAWNLYQQLHSYRAVSTHIGISLSSVRERLKRADEKMRHAAISEADTRAGRTTQAARRAPDRYAAIARSLLAERDGLACYLCRGATFALDELVIEHIIPRSAGGGDDPANLALACVDCNTRKGACIVSMLAPSGRAVYHQPR